jgi:hypothetical protein
MRGIERAGSSAAEPSARQEGGGDCGMVADGREDDVCGVALAAFVNGKPPFARKIESLPKALRVLHGRLVMR